MKTYDIVDYLGKEITVVSKEVRRQVTTGKVYKINPETPSTIATIGIIRKNGTTISINITFIALITDLHVTLAPTKYLSPKTCLPFSIFDRKGNFLGYTKDQEDEFGITYITYIRTNSPLEKLEKPIPVHVFKNLVVLKV